MTNSSQQVLINGQWRASSQSAVFSPTNPTLGEPIALNFPVSQWSDCDEALTAASNAFVQLRTMAPEAFATFLEKYANLIEADKEGLVEIAHLESGLAKSPRLADVELPRTLNQLRLAATAARQQNWSVPTIDSKANLRSCYQAIGDRKSSCRERVCAIV